MRIESKQGSGLGKAVQKVASSPMMNGRRWPRLRALLRAATRRANHEIVASRMSLFIRFVQEPVVLPVKPSRRMFMSTVVVGGAFSALVATAAPAQEVTRGFDRTLRSYATGEELNRQRNIWVMEVQLKPMRMVFVDTVDPKTGEKRKEQIWYLAYRAINRPLANRKTDDDTVAQNDIEPLPGPDKFIPAFTLVAYDDPKTELPVATHEDAIIPEAQKIVNRVERRYAEDPVFLNSVQVTQDLPAPQEKSPEEKWIYGVATFRGVDPDTDFFKVILRGFSNGYQKEDGPDGQPVVSRKVGVQKFIRRGDRFDPTQSEFLFDETPRWEYQPDRSRPAGPEAPAAGG
jgi:hypothetical protein